MPDLSREKPLCEWSKSDLRERWAEFSRLVAQPRHGCTKCGRAAATNKALCKPKKLDLSEDSLPTQ